MLNMSFIYDKTSLGKGGMIGTVYHNYHRSALIVIFIFPGLLPKDPAILKVGAHISYMDLCMPSQAL